MVVKWPFFSSYFLGVCQTCTQPQFTSEAITFEGIKILTRSASQNDHLSISFVKDKHTCGKEIAGNGHKIFIYELVLYRNRVYHFLLPKIISAHCARLKFVELHELRGQSIKNMIEASSMPYSIIEILLQAFVVCTINVHNVGEFITTRPKLFQIQICFKVLIF